MAITTDDWKEVIRTLADFQIFQASETQQKFLEAIQRQVARWYQEHPGVANAHDFDAIYPAEFELLKQKVENLKVKGLAYQAAESSKTYTIYNRQNTLKDYQTNREVEDFIAYLEGDFVKEQPFIKVNGKQLPAAKVVSIVKQMLGLEPKAIDTSGGFAPYLGHSMLYAKPDSPKGDEVLGRVWCLMNSIVTKADVNASVGDQEALEALLRDATEYRRSVVLAILEAAEVSQSTVDTHCQTRMTGELLKLACWHLEGSTLRRLIAADDSLVVQSDTDIELRIAAAPKKAENIFKAMFRVETPNVRALWARHSEAGTNPELFELYLAYYDDLYRRAPVRDAAGAQGKIQYKKDEHILERDQRGNLVSKYNADGTLRVNPQGQAAPEIVYYQAEFAVLEHEFSKRMKAEFEEQRGLVY
jgi:hypothetical protein